jgi:transposase-like protein
MAQELVLLTEWRERLKRQSESGLTVEAFCEKEGVSTSMFYRWQRHFQNGSPESTASRAGDAVHRPGKKRGGRPRRQQPEAAPTTEPAAMLPRECLRLPVRSGRSMPWIELTLANGTVIRIPQENHAALSIVLQTLRPESSGPLAEARHA